MLSPGTQSAPPGSISTGSIAASGVWSQPPEAKLCSPPTMHRPPPRWPIHCSIHCELLLGECLGGHVAEDDRVERGQLGHGRGKAADAVDLGVFGDPHELAHAAGRDEHDALDVFVFGQGLLQVGKWPAKLVAIADADRLDRLRAPFDIEHANFRPLDLHFGVEPVVAVGDFVGQRRE